MHVSSEVEDDVNAPAASAGTLPSRTPATSDSNRQVTRATGVRAKTTTRLSLVTPTVGGWAKSEDHSCSRRCGYRGLCRLLRGTQADSAITRARSAMCPLPSARQPTGELVLV